MGTGKVGTLRFGRGAVVAEEHMGSPADLFVTPEDLDPCGKDEVGGRWSQHFVSATTYRVRKVSDTSLPNPRNPCYVSCTQVRVHCPL